ncbi:hypothetical protein EG328_009308 [Venturia inaequalis]|uniref:Uncharacterized protein n=1 Tax=Venturia inaequalis TaxID=5025 RepID=A0A8H3YM86_VENIN|nr:hypothetical protein EG327_001040 [Venturia inaequalis]KAE9965905.1 hypothetical protein EG328_009308 [Venturia inaequalis]RDI76312.1 hypothetical protein Vi05172_g13699 [Venturia inaequalis]
MFFPPYVTFGLLATLASTTPIPEKSTNLTTNPLTTHSPLVLHNTASPSAHTKMPYYCSFPANEFWYLAFTYYTRNACIGVDTFDESPTPWSPQEYQNIYAVMDLQVTKDGIFKTSQVGCWVANFDKFTGAIRDREGYKDAFRLAMENGKGLKDAGFKRFYFQLDGGYTVVGRLALC